MSECAGKAPEVEPEPEPEPEKESGSGGALVLILLLAVRELWLGVRAIRRDGWRLKAPADGEEA